jgi:hypothetical protein
MTDLAQEQPGELVPDTPLPSPIVGGVGRTSASERDAITSDEFFFWLTPRVIVNPFDIMAVGQVNQTDQPESRTYGLVTTLEHRTDASNHLTNYISSDFGALGEEPNSTRQGTTVASATVLSNTADVYMPVPSERVVTFAQPQEIQQALGTDSMLTHRPQNAIPAGLIEMSNGAAARRYVLGLESVHVNISGISGLATKTSYAMFLIQSILQKAPYPGKIAVIILNVKQAYLLQIHLADPDLSEEQREVWGGSDSSPALRERYLSSAAGRAGGSQQLRAYSGEQNGLRLRPGGHR